MVTATRSTAVGALEFILKDILAVDVGMSIRMALNASGTTDIVDFLELTRQDFNEITWTKDDASTPGPLKLKVSEHNKLLALQDWFKAQPNPTVDTWFELTPEIFQQFQLIPPTPALPQLLRHLQPPQHLMHNPLCLLLSPLLSLLHRALRLCF